MEQFTEKEAEDFLEKNGFPVVKRVIVKNKKELSKVKIEFPWVMKVSSKKIMHKAKVGGVKKDINSLKQAEENFETLSKIESFEEAIIQKQILGKEIILGIKNTPEFGQVLMFGKGGTNIEKEKDVSFRIIPIDNKEIAKIIQDTKISKELTKTEIEKIKDSINKLQKIALNLPKINEMDINPLIINDKGYAAVDVRYSLN